MTNLNITPSQPTATQAAECRLPGVSRILNSTSARAAVILATLSASACGGQVNVDGDQVTIVEGNTCDPHPTCPTPKIGIYGTGSGPDDDLYLDKDRSYRIDPNTDEIHKVCEPARGAICEEGQDPVLDSCDLPVCENATTCDPIPAPKFIPQTTGHFVSRRPNMANFPTESDHYYQTWSHYYDNTIEHPVIYDSIPDCTEDVEGESMYACDMIPTCPEDEQLKYCDPLPRCAPGESPISCSESDMGGSSLELCAEKVDNIGYFIESYGLPFAWSALTPELCQEVWNPNIQEYSYKAPNVTINCLPTPECQEGEDPYHTTLTVNMDCGEYGQWSSSKDNSPSCDPIKSCN